MAGNLELATGDEGATELRKALREMDIPSRNKDHELMQGIDVVKRLLASGRVKIHRRCTNLIYELSRGYIFPLNEQKREREQPLDANNQACKALEQWAYLRAR